MLYVVLQAHPSQVRGAVAWPVVGQQAADGDAETVEIGDSLLQEGGGTRAVLSGQDLGEGDARVVVDGHMHVIPSQAAGAASHIAMDACAHGAETA